MPHRIVIRSRSGNLALAAIGAIYLITALATLLYYLATTWGAAALLDLLLQLTLAAAALAGAFFLATAAGNLGALRRQRHHS